MASRGMTKRELDALPATGKRYEVALGSPSRFYVRVGPTGDKSFVVRYRHQRQTRCLTLGNYGYLTLEQARELAKKKLGDVANGKDPAGDKATALAMSTVGDIADRILDEYGPDRLQPSTLATYKSIIKKKIRPAFGSKKIDAITSAMVNRWHQDMRQTPRQANQGLAILKRMMNLAKNWGLRPPALGNPCEGVDLFPENKRDRTWTLDEVAKVFMALDELRGEPKTLFKTEKKPKTTPEKKEPPAALDCFRLMLYTGARPGEIRELTWEEVDLLADPPVLRLRRGKEVKRGDQKGKTIALNDLAVALIKAQTATLGNPYVFPGRVKGKPFVGLWRIFQRVLERAGIDPTHIHDLRHTFGTLAGALGHSPHMIQAALNHKTSAMTDRYVNLKDVQKATVAGAVAEALKTAQPKRA